VLHDEGCRGPIGRDWVEADSFGLLPSASPARLLTRTRRPYALAAAQADPRLRFSTRCPAHFPSGGCGRRRYDRALSAKLPQAIPIEVSGLAVTLALSLMLAPLLANAQSTGKVYGIGHLSPALAHQQTDQAFELAMKELGYVEGHSLLRERRARASEALTCCV
jgi:hypothetical protein